MSFLTAGRNKSMIYAAGTEPFVVTAARFRRPPHVCSKSAERLRISFSVEANIRSNLHYPVALLLWNSKQKQLPHWKEMATEHEAPLQGVAHLLQLMSDERGELHEEGGGGSRVVAAMRRPPLSPHIALFRWGERPQATVYPGLALIMVPNSQKLSPPLTRSIPRPTTHIKTLRLDKK